MRGYIRTNVEDAAANIKNNLKVYPRDPGARIYKDTDSEWVMGYADKDTYFLKRGLVLISPTCRN